MLDNELGQTAVQFRNIRPMTDYESLYFLKSTHSNSQKHLQMLT